MLADAVGAVLAKAAVGRDEVDFAFFGLPAYGEDSTLLGTLSRLPQKFLRADAFLCGNDMVCGWAGSLLCRDGISIVAGTGSICYGERNGAVARSGGWGELFSDEGSAYWIACRGLNLFSRMSDGRRPRGPFYELVKQSLSLGGDLDLCAHVFSRLGGDRAHIAQLSKLVTQAARAGDEDCRSIIGDAAAELALLVEATRRQLGFSAAEPVDGLLFGRRVRARRRAAGASLWLAAPAIQCGLSGRRARPATRHRRRVVRREAARTAVVGRGHRAAAGAKRGPAGRARVMRRAAALRRLTACGGLLLTAAAACGAAPPFTAADFATVDKIDVHVHINSPDTALIDEAQADHFRLLTINVDYPDFPPLPEQARIAQALVANHPATLAYAASFSMQGWDQPDWQQQVIRQLDQAFADGAVGVKVWKNIGMEFRDARGRLVMIDDPKFDPVFDFIRERHRVLIGHQGEPHNCWLPIDQMTVNNDKEYFREHPQYHMYLHPELPSYEDQMAARDRMLAKNPQLKFMGAHLASLEWSVDRLAAFLDRYPNTVVDLAARMGQVQYQSNRERDKVRRFFVRYQDRLLYGSDLSQDPGGDPREVRREATRHVAP